MYNSNELDLIWFRFASILLCSVNRSLRCYHTIFVHVVGAGVLQATVSVTLALCFAVHGVCLLWGCEFHSSRSITSSTAA